MNQTMSIARSGTGDGQLQIATRIAIPTFMGVGGRKFLTKSMLEQVHLETRSMARTLYWTAARHGRDSLARYRELLFRKGGTE